MGDNKSLTATWFPHCIVLTKSYHTCGGPSYKVPTLHIMYGGTIIIIDSHKVPTFHIRYGGTIRVIDSYKVPALHCPEKNHIVHMGGPSYKVPAFHISYWRDHKSLTVTRFPNCIVLKKSDCTCGDPDTRFPHSI